MKSNGIEIRPNGNEIRRSKRSRSGYVSYNVFVKTSAGFAKSLDGPFDYLCNARNTADNAKKEDVRTLGEMFSVGRS